MFVSAADISKFPEIAKIYLLKRKDDYEKFCKELDFILTEKQQKFTANVVISFKNSDATLHHTYTPSGVKLEFFDIKGENTTFDSFEQFAAYYLARYW